MLRIIFLLLLLAFIWAFTATSHPVQISAGKRTQESRSNKSHIAEVVLTPYGYRPVSEIEPEVDTRLTNMVQRIHPLIWTAMFTFLAIGASYLLIDVEKKSKARRERVNVALKTASNDLHQHVA